MGKVQFFGFDCVVVRNSYKANQQIALSLIADDTPENLSKGIHAGEPVATATVCFPGEAFAKD